MKRGKWKEDMYGAEDFKGKGRCGRAYGSYGEEGVGVGEFEWGFFFAREGGRVGVSK